MTEKLLFTSAAGFEAARRVMLFAEGHRSRRLHGHSFLARIRTTVPKGFAQFPGAEVTQLQHLLTQAVQPLDYQFLNDRLSGEPTDENLARWLREQLPLPDIAMVGIRSTRHAGVDLNRDGHAHVWCRYLFDSAHQLPNVPPGHPCGRMHGHGFAVILHAHKHIGLSDISIDYDRLTTLWDPIFKQLHCRCLNEIPGLENPTSEMISRWIWQRLKPELPELSWVTVFETASSGTHYDGNFFRIWKELSLDSAVLLSRAPKDNQHSRVHGHTFTLRLHLNAPLDEVMGWTIDFGDVKKAFNPLFTLLDHHPLHERKDLLDTDCASLARWIQSQATPLLPHLDRIDLYETPGCGVILSCDQAALPKPEK
ncbi:MAG: 6-carboxytetrahydropterin synthase [Magnetococcales bacterium]|nr:6-carboxytetrahydropterin synthase [Magnetococcales bacterium]